MKWFSICMGGKVSSGILLGLWNLFLRGWEQEGRSSCICPSWVPAPLLFPLPPGKRLCSSMSWCSLQGAFGFNRKELSSLRRRFSPLGLHLAQASPLHRHALPLLGTTSLLQGLVPFTWELCFNFLSYLEAHWRFLVLMLILQSAWESTCFCWTCKRDTWMVD